MDLIKYLPEIIMWIVTGFSFLKVYHFVALRQNSMDVEHILTSSIVVGYIYCNIAYLIPISFNKYADNILIVLSSVITAYFIAKIVSGKRMIPILDFLHILDTGNRYMWDDLMDERYSMKISIVCNGIRYEGMAHNIESYTNSPHIALASYAVYDGNNKEIANHITDDKRVIVIDTSNAESVEIIYNAQSTECRDLKSLCDYNKHILESEQEPQMNE